MNLLDKILNLFGQSKAQVVARPTPPRDREAVSELVVPEVSAAELRTALQKPSPPLLLDVREAHEWTLVHIPDAAGRTVLHIPMNEVPQRLAELPKAQPLVVCCAHGSRSHDVAHWLIEQGYQARSLSGGVTAWARAGGDVEMAKTTGSGGGGGNWG